MDLALFEAVYRRNADAFDRRDLDTAYGWLPVDFEWYPLPVVVPPRDSDVAGSLRGPKTGLRSTYRYTQVWELADDGRPLRVRERLDSVTPPA